MKRILVIHGPNLNLLGQREPELYGTGTLADLDQTLRAEAGRLGLALETFQSNHEGELIDKLQQARDTVDGLILNPGGLTHTSVSLRDAVAALPLPVIEAHLTNLFAREPFRQQDVIAPACRGVVMGLGPLSYVAALRALKDILGGGETDHARR
jgi:3-dehydroquinate dehydratase type II